MEIKIKRVYEEPEDSDGIRILVDRIWPRGLSKEKAAADFWLKDIAPSTALRKWFNHDPEKWAQFKSKYKTELKNNTESMAELKKNIGRNVCTLLYGAKDELHNQAVVIKEWLSKNESDT